MGAVLLAAGAAGKRFALPNARIMIHQPWGGVQGQASDISIQAKEILRLRDRLNEILAAAHRQGARGRWRRTPTATSSCPPRRPSDYGLVDEVVAPRRLPGGPKEG